MRTEMRMPQMGESITEATILKWLKGVGESVNKDETVLEISTDKVDSEIPAPAAGKIVEILAKEGSTVPVKSVIAIIDSAADAAASAPRKEDKKEEKKEEKAAKAAPRPAPAASSAPASTAASAPAQAAAPEEDLSAENSSSGIPAHMGERFFSPLVRNMAAQHGISPNELAGISGSGAQGRVTKDDVNVYLQHRDTGAGGNAQGQQGRRPEPVQAPAAARPQYDANGTRVEPMDNMRKLIAEHMVRSKATSPHVYSVTEVDVTNISKWRKRMQDSFLAREGFKLSFTPFFLEATVKALMQFPKVNASVDGETIVLKRDVNLGCAVALGKDGLDGLIVPVIKQADQLNFVGVARSLNDLANRARTKKLTPGDVQGGTFTVTNPGVFGNLMGCPIINQPQLAILALGAIVKRPVVVDDAIAIREMVLLTLSYDHRVIDGALSGHFLSYLKKYLESWDMNRAV